MSRAPAVAGHEGARATAPSRPEVEARLRRVQGQVAGVLKMYEQERYCIDVLDQLAAARAGLEATALLILDDHVNSCVREALVDGGGGVKTSELVAAVRRFVRSV